MAERCRIAIKDIALNDDRRVGGKGALHTLAHSIEEVGLINPITVRKSKEGHFLYTIIAGRRRVEAVILLEWTEIDAVIYEADEREDEAFFTHVALAENVNRLDLHPIDEGAQYARLLKEGATLNDLTAYFDRSASHIYQRMKLIDLIQEVQELFRKERIKISAAAKIASLPKKVQKEIYQNLVKNQRAGGDTDKAIDCIIGQMMRMPLDFPCEACKTCITKRTHYSSSLLFPEYSEQNDYCMDSRCYERNIRNFYQKEVSEFLKNWTDAKSVYIYEDRKDKAEYLRNALEKKPLTETVPVHVYHESFEECRQIQVLDEEEEHVLHSSSRELLKDCFIAPVLCFQDKEQEPDFYIAVDDETYEKLFSSYSDDAMEEETETDEIVEAYGCDTDGNADAGYTDSSNQEQDAFGAEQSTEGDARDEFVLAPFEQAKVFKQALLEYLQLERNSGYHPFFHSAVFLRILEERPYFEEAFYIVMGCTLQDFYQKKRYEDLTYRILLEIYVYSSLFSLSMESFDRHRETIDGIPILKGMGLNGEAWRALYEGALHRFLKERTDGAHGEAAQEGAEKKTVVAAGM